MIRNTDTDQPHSGSPSNAGVRVLDNGHDALLARAAMIESARSRIDAQYYIWNSDASGQYLAIRLYRAAQRGVKIRVLLDDINTAGRDGVFAGLAVHPNVEIRLYNPFSERGALRTLGFVREFARLNRRMHDKSFTVDDAITILGGRNIGDEYFDSGEYLNFRDCDVLVEGAPVSEVARMFEAFWCAPLTRNIDALTGTVASLSDHEMEQALNRASRVLKPIHRELPVGAVEGEQRLAAYRAQMTSVVAQLIYDPPADPARLAATDSAQPSALAFGELAAAAREDVLIESAYLVPEDVSLERLGELVKKGVKVRALTNSLASNDVTANHAAYAGRRKKILAAGIELYEFRPDADSLRKRLADTRVGNGTQVFGLHAKTFVFDRATVYIGSLNLNLRSRYLNAESGLIIRSEALARQLADSIELTMQPTNSWRVVLNRSGTLSWLEAESEAGTTLWTHEPGVALPRRLLSAFIASLGLEKYL